MQIHVEVSDQKNPEKTATATVQVKVKRDLYTPEFVSATDVDIDVNHAVNESSVITVQATDRDRVVSGISVIHSQWLSLILSLASCFPSRLLSLLLSYYFSQ